MLKTKSVWSPPARSDGLRILATRLHGRGLSKDRYDVWMANLGPSEQLLGRIRAGAIGWPAFQREYVREMRMAGAIDARNRRIRNHGQKFTLRLLAALARKGNVTLMCHCAEDAVHCHRHVLKRLVKKTAGRSARPSAPHGPQKSMGP